MCGERRTPSRLVVRSPENIYLQRDFSVTDEWTSASRRRQSGEKGGGGWGGGGNNFYRRESRETDPFLVSDGTPPYHRRSIMERLFPILCFASFRFNAFVERRIRWCSGEGRRDGKKILKYRYSAFVLPLGFKV